MLPERPPSPMIDTLALECCPPLPPRPPVPPTPAEDPRAALQAPTTTAVSSVDIQTLTFPDGTRATFQALDVDPAIVAASAIVAGSRSGHATPRRFIAGVLTPDGRAEDAMSVTSVASFLAPTARPTGDIVSLLAAEPGLRKRSAAWTLLRSQSVTLPPFVRPALVDGPDVLADFECEFDPLPGDEPTTGESKPGGAGECIDDAIRLSAWKAKLKHYLILSSAGKPVYSRHGDLALINASVGVIQTIISFFEAAQNQLLGFTAGDTRFVVVTEGPLYLVAISRLGESDGQLRAQLDALYMQILSTLTLPTLTNLFANRPSTDLRRPLQGTEQLLSSLADSFTRGSPSALLGALECLQLRKSQRSAANSALLKLRCERLLYGMLVAGGRLVSVVRPRRHSLHPVDLQLIFNMLFQSGGVKASGGESWIPLCLPTFNSRGYLYLYVSFFSDRYPRSPIRDPPPSPSHSDDQIALVLISADKESFFELRQMCDNVVQKLTKSGLLATISAAVRAGRPRTSDVAPGGQISHFLYKHRANVQFCMSSLDEPTLGGVLVYRRLMTLYHQLHTSVHTGRSSGSGGTTGGGSGMAGLRVMHCADESASSLAWITPAFEFYCVGGPNMSRAGMTRDANKIVHWAKREEDRLFIIGGAVF